mgnify:CR=1 FL=1
MKSKKTKSIKLLAASTAICTAIGVTSVLTSVDAFASSITQESGNDTKGKLEIVTNPFKTFEDVEDFVDNTLESLLNNQAYRFTIGPLDLLNPEEGYILRTVLSYNSETFSKSQAEALANKLIAVADATITGNNLSGTIKPAEAGNVPSGTIKPTEEGNKPSGTIKPAEEGNAPSGTIKPTEEGNAPSGTIKPTEAGNAPSGTIKPAEAGNAPLGTIKLTEEGNVPSGTTKPTEEGNKPSKSLEDKNKFDTKLKEDKINKSINKSEGDLGKKETKSVLPKTGETTSSLLLIGVIMAGLGISFAVKRKQG